VFKVEHTFIMTLCRWLDVWSILCLLYISCLFQSPSPLTRTTRLAQALTAYDSVRDTFVDAQVWRHLHGGVRFLLQDAHQRLGGAGLGQSLLGGGPALCAQARPV
jgi:hypothetical protein